MNRNENKSLLEKHISMLETERSKIESEYKKRTGLINKRIVVATILLTEGTPIEIDDFLSEYIDRDFEDWLFDWFTSAKT